MSTRKKAEHLKPHDFKPAGEQPLRRNPVSVKLPPELDDYVRSKPNRNQWLIEVIASYVEKEKELSLNGIRPRSIAGREWWMQIDYGMRKSAIC